MFNYYQLFIILLVICVFWCLKHFLFCRKADLTVNSAFLVFVVQLQDKFPCFRISEATITTFVRNSKQPRPSCRKSVRVVPDTRSYWAYTSARDPLCTPQQSQVREQSTATSSSRYRKWNKEGIEAEFHLNFFLHSSVIVLSKNIVSVFWIILSCLSIFIGHTFEFGISSIVKLYRNFDNIN